MQSFSELTVELNQGLGLIDVNLHSAPVSDSERMVAVEGDSIIG